MHEDSEIITPAPLEWDGKYYLQLVITTDELNASRNATNPDGGPDGDGSITGKVDENLISNATFIIYKKSIANKAFSADDKVFATLYFSSFTLNGNYWLSEPVELPFTLTDDLKASDFYAMAVTNAGDMSATFRPMTLANLCKYTFSAAQKSASGFVMSSSSEFNLRFSGAGAASFNAETGIYTSGNINVQRLMARIDLIATLNASNYKTSGITLPDGYSQYTSAVRYEVKTRDDLGNETTNLDEYFVLTDFQVLNAYTGSTYLIKRVAADAEGTVSAYFGAETKDANKNATNYVVSPTDNQASHFATIPSTLAEAVALPHTYTIDASEYTSYTVQYVRENTNRSSHYTTLRLNGFIGKETSSGSWNFSSAKRQSYDIVLRHSDPDGTGSKEDIMHYGVVRNNIYRVGISKIVRLSVGSAAVYWYYYSGSSTSDYEEFPASISSVIEDNGPETPND